MHDQLYREEILEHYKNPLNYGELADPDGTGQAANHVCGDFIKLQIRLDGEDKDVVANVKFQNQGCAISTAAASILTEAIQGKTLKELQHLNVNYVLDLLALKLTPARVKCALLPWMALEKALKDL